MLGKYPWERNGKMGKRDREIPDSCNEVKVPGGIMKITITERKRPIPALSIIFAVTMDARGTMATTFVVTEKGKSNEND